MMFVRDLIFGFLCFYFFELNSYRNITVKGSQNDLITRKKVALDDVIENLIFKLEEQKARQFQLEIKKLENEIKKLEENIEALRARNEEYFNEKAGLENIVYRKRFEMSSLYEKYTIIQDFIKAEFELSMAKFEEEISRNELTSSYSYGAAQYADANAAYLGSEARFYNAIAKFRSASSKLKELKIPPEYDIYQLKPYFSEFFKSIEKEIDEK